MLDKIIDESGLISAIWILSCNDKKSLMLYKSVKHRLGLPDSYKLEELLKKYGELFRLRIPKSALEIWKEEMVNGENRPSYIIEIKDKTQREREINSIESEAGFRSQFRAEPDSPISDITIINWGLEYIERLRKSATEKDEIKWKWLNNGVIPILSTLITLSALFVTYWSQTASIESQEVLKKYELDSQEKLKKYEVSFVQRSDNYVSMMKYFNLLTENIEGRNTTNFQTNSEQMEASYYKIRPFLNVEAQSRLYKTLKDFNQYMNKFNNKGLSASSPIKDQIMYKEFKNYFEETLYKDLFEQAIM